MVDVEAFVADGYVKIPDFIMNKVGKGVETMLRKLYKRDLITYHGNG